MPRHASRTGHIAPSFYRFASGSPDFLHRFWLKHLAGPLKEKACVCGQWNWLSIVVRRRGKREHLTFFDSKILDRESKISECLQHHPLSRGLHSFDEQKSRSNPPLRAITTWWDSSSPSCCFIFSAWILQRPSEKYASSAVGMQHTLLQLSSRIKGTMWPCFVHTKIKQISSTKA